MSIREDIEEEVRAKYGTRIAALNDEIRKHRREVEEMDKRLGEEQAYAKMGRDFEAMLKATKNPIVKDAWNKFMMALRMTGNDE